MNEKVGQLSFPKQDGQWPQDRIYSEGTAEVQSRPSHMIPYKRLHVNHGLIASVSWGGVHSIVRCGTNKTSCCS